MKLPEIYFVNYKNSVAGVGGVGTVSRDLIRYYPKTHFVFWDGSDAVRSLDLDIKIKNVNHNEIHRLFFKKYLWSVLHGLECTVDKNTLNNVRNDLRIQTDQITNEIIKISRKASIPAHNIYWVNDYTSVTLVEPIRHGDKESTIIFSFRTPFGKNGIFPKMQKADVLTFGGLLKADLVTFHRLYDMKMYINFFQDKHSGPIVKVVKIDKMHQVITCNDGSMQELLVVPMGGNKKYRKQLLRKKTVKNLIKTTSNKYRNKQIITSISRFERTKGIEYEVELIEKLLKDYPDIREKFVFLRYTYRSKTKIDDHEYAQLHEKIIDAVEKVNRKYGNDSWLPIVYNNNHKLNDEEVTATLSASDIVLIASVADGFNHLALEAIRSQRWNRPKIQLLLSDIGAADYIDGYSSLTLDSNKDVGTLYNAILRSSKEVNTTYGKLKSSSKYLSSKVWIDTIINKATTLAQNKVRKVKHEICNNHTS